MAHRSDVLSGILPDRRFITIHPALLDIMSYHEAALVHEINWRAEQDRRDGREADGWVHRPPAMWREELHFTEKQLRYAIDQLAAEGYIEVAKPNAGRGDHSRAMRLSWGAIRSAIIGRSDSPSLADPELPERADLHRSEERFEERVVGVPSSPVPSLPPEPTDPATTPSGRSTTSPHPQTPAPGTTVPASEVDESRLDPVALAALTATRGKEARGIAPSDPPAPDRSRRIKRADSLIRCLEPHGIRVESQADHRNVAKLLDKNPTISQLDGAINALLTMEGKVDLGRLVVKWASLHEEAARPKAWTNPRRERRDRFESHVSGGGNPQTFNEGERVDYGL